MQSTENNANYSLSYRLKKKQQLLPVPLIVFWMLVALILGCFCSAGEKKDADFSLISEMDFLLTKLLYLAVVSWTWKSQWNLQAHWKIKKEKVFCFVLF